MEPIKQYVFMFVAGGQARGHCKVQCVGGRARIQVQVRLEVTADTPPLLAVFDAGGNPYKVGSLTKSGASFTLSTDIAWPAQAVCTGAAAADDAGTIQLSAGKLPYDASRALQKALGMLQPGEEVFSPKTPKPAPAEPVRPSPAVERSPAPPPPLMEEKPEIPPEPPVLERIQVAPEEQAAPSEQIPPGAPSGGGTVQYWWQEPRCPYTEMQPPPQEMQPGYEQAPPYAPPDACDPSYRMQDAPPEFAPAQPQRSFGSSGFFTGMQQEDLPSGVVSCPAAALHQADPFHGGEFAGWSWCKVQYEGLHWHYLIGENKSGQGPWSRAVGVPGQYSLRPPPHLKGFDRFAVSRDGTGYWLYFERSDPDT